MSVDIGIWIPSYAWNMSDRDQERKTVHRLRDYILRCEELGFDIWVIDHLLSAPGLYSRSWLEPLSVLTYAAALTENIKVGTGILAAPLRNPVLLAKEIATLDQLSNGRFVFGVGTGWEATEYAATGSHISERGKRTDEVIDAVRLLLSRDHASFEGQYYKFEDVTIEPRPLQVPEVWVAGGSRVPDPASRDKDYIPQAVLERIVAADAWLARGAGTQEGVLRDWATLRQHLEARGRSPDSFRFAHANFIEVRPGLSYEQALEAQRDHAMDAFGDHRPFEKLPQSYLLGDVEHQVERLTELAEHGMSYVVLGPLSYGLDQLDAIKEHIEPRLQG